MSNPTAITQAVDSRTRFLDELAATGQFDHPAWKSANHLARYDAGSGKCRLSDPNCKALFEQANDDAMAIPFIVSTWNQDRDGDVIIPGGVKRYLDFYAKNPIWLFGHNAGLLPIGLSRDKAGKCTVEVGDDRIVATCYFHKETEIARDTYRLVKAGILNATSIGFIPHKGKRIKKEEDPNLDRNDVDFDWPGYIFTEWELCEISVVVIQSNRDAIRLSLDKGIDGRPLGTQARCLIEPYAPPKKAIVPSGWMGESVVLPKDAYPTEVKAVEYLASKGMDTTCVEEDSTTWVFRQPFSGFQFCRPNGDGDKMSGVKETNVTQAGKSTGTNTSGEPMAQQGTEKPRKGKKVPPEALKMLAALYGVSVKEIGEQAGEHEEPDGDENEETQLPPGATVLCAFKELCESAIPMTEETNVKRFLERTMKEATKTAFKAYPDLDLGFEPVEDEDDEEDDDGEEREFDEDEEEDEDGDEKEYDDDEDKEDDDEDEDEEKALERLQARFTKVTGVEL